MADIRAIGTLHTMKHSEKGTTHAHVEHDNNNSDSALTDLEKTASHGVGYDMDGIAMDNGEYVVTAKTWAVVMVQLHDLTEPYCTKVLTISRRSRYRMESPSGQFHFLAPFKAK